MYKFVKYLASMNWITLTETQLVGSVLAQGDAKTYDDDRGFGQVYKWRNIVRGFREAKETGKPIFLIVHRDTCPACQRLKDKFSKSMQLIDLSVRFVMINVESAMNSLNGDKKFEPDGKYVPRILFYTSHGELISEAYNRHADDPKFRYFYSSPSEIIESMRYVIKDYPPNEQI